MPQKLELYIPTETILKVAAVFVALWFLWVVRDILILFFIVLILVTAMSPIIDRWSTKMARPLAIALLYGMIFSAILVALSLIIPPLVIQIRDLARNLPDYVQDFLPRGSLRDVVTLSQASLSSISEQLSNIGASLYSTTSAFVSGLFAIFTVLVLTFYLLVEEKGARKFFLSLVPNEDRRQRLVEAVEKIGTKMGAWVRGQLLLMLVVGLIDMIGLFILGVPYALTLGVWAGLTEIVTYVGPIVGAIPAAVIAFGESPVKGVLVIVLFALVQQIEAQFLVPKIMQRAVGLSPVVIILAILIGAKLMGLLGVVLAVPLAAGLAVLLQEEWPKLRQTLDHAEKGL